ncbi:uncharacterized protein N7458_011428 [Penicillium daleae]|uniref:Uncharacterized protein n=1 Tax=Penicillium daleae TaxID=63821 RepID=A0AAD6FWH5_9EURO|nr:uncharacterized protein N7458_011428 [Penicillium daleae]KAJ5432272.1 hypothetical protein N7458_011428 [Penicillium daleae]
MTYSKLDVHKWRHAVIVFTLPYTTNYANRSPADPSLLAEPSPCETVDYPLLPSQNYLAQSRFQIDIKMYPNTGQEPFRLVPFL